jgi:hypothetical protein
MIIFIKLLLAHLLGDFLLQPNSWVADKERRKHRSIYLYAHTLLHGIIAWMIIGTIEFGWYALLLTVAHGIIDLLKLQLQKESTKRAWFLLDQLLHVMVLGLITILYNDTTLKISDIDQHVWVIITSVVLLTSPSSILIKTVISIWTPNQNDTKEDLQNAGKYIGILERLFVFCFIVIGQFSAIGFLMAAKSIFRFGDLTQAKDRKLTEYVLIGTLLSFGIAILTGLLAKHLLSITI